MQYRLIFLLNIAFLTEIMGALLSDLYMQNYKQY